MQVRTLAVGGVLVGAASLGLTVSAAPASAFCETYSGTCASPGPDSDVISDDVADDDAVQTSTTNADRPATLPFTGGELVLLTALGAGALAGGTALVVAGRRKPGSAA